MTENQQQTQDNRKKKTLNITANEFNVPNTKDQQFFPQAQNSKQPNNQSQNIPKQPMMNGGSQSMNSQYNQQQIQNNSFQDQNFAPQFSMTQSQPSLSSQPPGSNLPGSNPFFALMQKYPGKSMDEYKKMISQKSLPQMKKKNSNNQNQKVDESTVNPNAKTKKIGKKILNAHADIYKVQQTVQQIPETQPINTEPKKENLEDDGGFTQVTNKKKVNNTKETQQQEINSAETQDVTQISQKNDKTEKNTQEKQDQNEKKPDQEQNTKKNEHEQPIQKQESESKEIVYVQPKNLNDDQNENKFQGKSRNLMDPPKQVTQVGVRKRQFLINLIQSLKEEPFKDDSEFFKLLQSKKKRATRQQHQKARKNNYNPSNNYNQQGNNPKQNPKGGNNYNSNYQSQQYQQNQEKGFRAPQNKEDILKKNQLQQAAGIWLKQQSNDTQQNLDLKNEKDIKFNLNLLTPDNYVKILGEILRIAKLSPNICSKLINCIIEKAWTEQKYCKTYAKLCNDLQNDKELNSKFRPDLLTKIQNIFEGEQDVIKTKKNFEDMDEDEKKEYQSKKKKKILGNVSFIGELYLVKVIKQKIIIICLSSMMNDIYNDYICNCPKEINEKIFLEYQNKIEGILTLFEKVGKQLEKNIKSGKDGKDGKKGQDKNAKANNECIKKMKDTMKQVTQDPTKEFEKYKSNIQQYQVEEIFDLLEYIKKSCKTSNRLRCLVENLLIRKNQNWQDRLFAGEGPTTINEIYQQFEKEKELIDKRAEDYYKQDNSNRQTGGYQNNVQPSKNQVQVQVQVGNRSSVTQSQAPQTIQNKPQTANSSKFTANLSFDMNRTKTVSTTAIKKQTLLGAHEVGEKLKDIFKKWEDGKYSTENSKGDQEEIQYPKTKAIEDLKEVIKNCQHKIDFISCFLNNFCDTKQNIAEERALIMHQFYKDELIDSKNDFLQAFNVFVNKKAWQICSDFPFLTKFIGKIYNSFVQDGDLLFNDIQITYWDDQEEFDWDNVDSVVDFYGELISAIKKINTDEKCLQDLESLKKRVDEKPLEAPV